MRATCDVTWPARERSGVSDHVFISYSHEDHAYVVKLSAFLRGQGFEVWYDYRIQAGDEFARRIEQRIDDCPVFMLVLTPASVESPWVRRELAYATNRRKPVIPLLLKMCKIPIEIANVHIVSVRGDEMPSRSTVDQVRQIVFGPRDGVPPGYHVPPPPPSSKGWIRGLLTASMVIVAVLAAGVGVYLFGSFVKNLDLDQAQGSPSDSSASGPGLDPASSTSSEAGETQPAVPPEPVFERYEVFIPHIQCKFMYVDLDGDPGGTGSPGSRPYVDPPGGGDVYLENCIWPNELRFSNTVSTKATTQTTWEECALLLSTQPTSPRFDAQPSVSVCTYTSLGNTARVDIVGVEGGGVTVQVTLWPGKSA